MFRQGVTPLPFCFPQSHFTFILTFVILRQHTHMKAVVYDNFQGQISIQNVPDPSPANHSVILKVEASGMCLSDWHGWMGHDAGINLPHVPGHELAGTIVAIGEEVRKWKTGQRVTVPFVGGCGICVYCQEGNQQVCDQQFQAGFTAWGSFAEYVVIDHADENLVALPEDLGFVEAASLGCRFITAYRGLIAQGQLSAGQQVAIHGCGGVGLSAIQIAKAAGARVIAIDITDEKCALAKSLGAEVTVNGRRENVALAVKEWSHGGVHLSVDALGHKETCLNSIYSLRKRGRHIQIGLMTEEHSSPEIPMPLIVANELEILGSHGMQAHQYPEMFKMIRDTPINLSAMISKTVRLADIPDLLPKMNQSKQPGITVISSF